MITPDDLARRFSAPLTAGELRDRQLQFADGAYQLAERALDLLPGGHHLEQAVLALESASNWICAGLSALQDETAAAAVDADLAAAALPAADGPVPYELGCSALPTRPVGLSVPDTIEGIGDLALDVALWRTGLRGTQLHPMARLVAHALAEAADAHGYIPDTAQPEINDLVLASGLDHGYVLQALEELATNGLISRHNDGGMTRYQLRLPLAPTPPREA